MEDFVVFDSVSKSYKVGDLEIAAVNDVSFSIAKGELDVYKRQPHIHRFPEWISPLPDLRFSAAVSYTHLDVYKRQDETFTNL